MFDFIVSNEPLLRALFAAGGLVLFLILGLLFRFRLNTEYTSPARIITNISLAITNTLLIKLLMPISLAGLALLLQAKNIGILNQLSFGTLTNFVITVVFLDLIIYWQHRTFHYVPLLWRLHRVHHSDTGLDATTALRFHPLEILLSLAIKGLAIFLLGASAAGVIVFEIILNFSALFHHGNYKLPNILDRIMRWIIVTPDPHRVHHSSRSKEMNSNFAFFLSVWDRIFKTFLTTTERQAEFVEIGIHEIRDTKQLSYVKLLSQPFQKILRRPV